METAFKVCLGCATLPPFLSWPFTPSAAEEGGDDGCWGLGKSPLALCQLLCTKHCQRLLPFPSVIALSSLVFIIWSELETTERWAGNPNHLHLSYICCRVKDKKRDSITVLISFLLLTLNVYHIAQCTLTARREKPNKAKEGFINVSLIRMGLW